MLDVADGAVLFDVDVEPVGVVVPGDHHARLDDTAGLREVFLAEVLGRSMSASIAPGDKRRARARCGAATYRLAVIAIRYLLADQLVGPLLGLVARGAGDSGDYERHVDGVSW